MKEKTTLVFAACCLLLGFALFIYDLGQPHYPPLPVFKPTMHPVTITGEVVDAWCYSSQTMGPGKGISHRACALACINGGVSVGILEEKTGYLYVAAKYKGYKGCKDVLLPYVGDKVTVTGWVGEKGGCRMLRIQTVKRISGPDDFLLEQMKQESQTAPAPVAKPANKPESMPGARPESKPVSEPAPKTEPQLQPTK